MESLNEILEKLNALESSIDLSHQENIRRLDERLDELVRDLLVRLGDLGRCK